MKKVVWVSLASFVLGILAAGYIFVFMPEHKASGSAFSDKSGSGTGLFAQTPGVKPDLDFVKVADKVGPAVVKVETDRVEKASQSAMSEGTPFDDFWNRFFDQPAPRRQEKDPKVTVQGTGFLVSADGFIITNNHLVESSQKTKVTMVSGENYTAKIVGTDPKSDLALIKIEIKNAPFVELGDSGLARVGEWVLAIGNPLGMEHTVTAGIVSAKGRQLGVNEITYQDYIQTDAAINRGNSGGPLVNLKGEVIGINSVILAPNGGNIGIGFAIPSNLAKKVIQQLKDKGKVVRGYLGIVPASIDDETREALKLKDKKGALISSVAANTPAAKAGLKPYDVVIEINGQKVDSDTDLRFKIADILPGSKVDVKVIRDGQVKTITATVAELSDDTPAASQVKSSRDTGLEVTEMSTALARRTGYRTRDCLVITDVAQGSDAERKGLSAGDLILEVNRVKVSTTAEWEQILEKTAVGAPLLLNCRRESNGQAQDFIVTIRVS
ncbi:MAG: Do family serine endopeptidase [Acidobacteriota bacterium]|nr:Do family serine endopeptidase [Acidobacteriota bacterium]